MKAKKIERKSKNKKALNNKKHKNNKILKAKEILAMNKAALTIESEKKKEAEKRSPALRIIKIVRNIFFGLLIFALAVIIISFLVVRLNGGTPAVFGYSIQRVSSGSMTPTLEVGDIILSKSVTSPDEIEIDDIITFKGDSTFDYNNVTHRVVVPPMQNAGGEYVLTTKGDANPVEDKEIPFSWVQSKYIRTLDFLHKFYDFFLSPWGLIIFIAALLIIFFDELMTVVRVITGNYDDEEEDESVGEIMTRLKAEEVEAFLQYQQEQERKKRRRAKHSNTSVKKQKNRKKSAEKKAVGDKKSAPKPKKKNGKKNPKKNSRKR